MKKCLKIILFAIILLPASVFAYINPDWYDISFNQNVDFLDHEWDIYWQGSYLQVGTLHVTRNQETAPWNNYDYEDEIVLEITRLNEPNPVYSTNYCLTELPYDSNDTVNYFIIQFKSSNPNQTLINSGSTVNMTATWDATTNITFKVLNNQPKIQGQPDPAYLGSYYGRFLFSIYVKDYEPNNSTNYTLVLLESHYVNMIAYYVDNSEITTEDIFTNLIVEEKPGIHALDLASIQASGSMVVGSVTFISSDTNQSHSYTLEISPLPDPLTGYRFIHRTNPQRAIPYKVYINGETGSSSYTIDRLVPSNNFSGTWQDYIELGISNINNGLPILVPAGNYYSEIQIKLESNY